ncbi:MAG: D-cysteine desulfhydrase family protein [Christensenellales bacterium]|jgi:L-cysteate sulfo-lyase
MTAIRELIARHPRLALTPLPTPLAYLKRLSAHLGGPRIYVKRDDIGSLAFGGNKTRKLEFIMAEARAAGADSVVTLGGLQSNWVRQLIAAARMCGMDAVAVLEGDEPACYQGNLLLGKRMGARLIYRPGITQEEEDREIASDFVITAPIADQLRAAGKTPFLAPLGGATPIGNLGYVNMIDELIEQLRAGGIRADRIVFATGTGGTQAGMALGLRLAQAPIALTGISVSYHTRPKEEEIADLCNASMAHYGLDARFAPADIRVNYDYVGAGYGDATDASIAAVKLAARLEGLILCHTYAGKALAGLIGMIERGEISKDETVVFVHTGGGIAGFATPDLYL